MTDFEDWLNGAKFLSNFIYFSLRLNLAFFCLNPKLVLAFLTNFYS